MHLYSKEIIDRSRDNGGHGVLEEPTHQGTFKNPICGDRVHWTLDIQNGTILQAKHNTKGCALCRASASILWEYMLHQQTDMVLQKVDQFCSSIEELVNGLELKDESLVWLFRDIRYAPLRKECVCLPWLGLAQILKHE